MAYQVCQGNFHLTWRLSHINQTGPQMTCLGHYFKPFHVSNGSKCSSNESRRSSNLAMPIVYRYIYRQKTDTVGQIHAYTSWSENLPNFSKSHQSLTRKIVNSTWAYQSQIRWLHLWRAITTSQKKNAPCCNASAAETSTCHPWKILAGGKAGRHPGPVCYNKYPMNHNDFTPSILQQPSNTHLAFVEPVCPMGWGQVDERLYLHHRCRLQITSGIYGKNRNCFIVCHRFFALLLSLKDFYQAYGVRCSYLFWRLRTALFQAACHLKKTSRKWPSYHFTARNTQCSILSSPGPSAISSRRRGRRNAPHTPLASSLSKRWMQHLGHRWKQPSSYHLHEFLIGAWNALGSEQWIWPNYFNSISCLNFTTSIRKTGYSRRTGIMNQSSIASRDLLEALVWLNTKLRMVQPVNTSL